AGTDPRKVPLTFDEFSVRPHSYYANPSLRAIVDLEPIPDEPVLMADDALVVADLHIGLEEELREKGIHIPSRAEAMGRKLAEIASRRGATRSIILGAVNPLGPNIA